MTVECRLAMQVINGSVETMPQKTALLQQKTVLLPQKKAPRSQNNNFILILTLSQDSNYDNYDCVNGIRNVLVDLSFLFFVFCFRFSSFVSLPVFLLRFSPFFFLFVRVPARRNVRNESSIEALH